MWTHFLFSFGTHANKVSNTGINIKFGNVGVKVVDISISLQKDYTELVIW